MLACKEQQFYTWALKSYGMEIFVRFSTLLILSSCILLTACTTSLQTKKGAETLVQAHDQLEEQNYEDARALFQQTLENSEDRVIQAESFHGLSLVAREQ